MPAAELRPARRGLGALTPLATVLATVVAPIGESSPAFATAIAPATSRHVGPIAGEIPANPADRIHRLELELAWLLATSAPSTWQRSRREFARVLRDARREIRTADRRRNSPLSAGPIS